MLNTRIAIHRKSFSHLSGLQLLPKGLGLILALEMLQLWPDLAVLFGQSALLDPILIQAQDELLGLSIPDIIHFLPPIQIGSIETIHLFGSLYIIMGLLLFVGTHVTLPAFILLLLHHCFFIGNYTWSYGVDYLAQTGLLFSVLFGSIQVTKLKSRIWSRWGSILFRLQLTFVYFLGGIGKATGKTWWNGEAIWKAVQQPFIEPLFAIPISAYSVFPIWVILGCTTALLEIAYPLLWFNIKCRFIIISGIMLMHLGISLSMGLIHFSILMIWYNYCAWGLPKLRIAKSTHKTIESEGDKIAGAFRPFRFNTKKGGTI